MTKHEFEQAYAASHQNVVFGDMDADVRFDNETHFAMPCADGSWAAVPITVEAVAAHYERLLAEESYPNTPPP